MSDRRRTPPLGPLALAVVLAAGLGMALARAVVPERGVRLVLVTIDTLRYDTFAGDKRRPSAMPRLLARAEGGVSFTHCYASTSVTGPTHATLLTGLHPWEHGATANGAELPARVETVAEVLAAEGFSTAAVVASFPVSARFGFDQGFVRFDDAFDVAPAVERQWRGSEVPEGRFFSLAPSITERALEALASDDSRRQFLWVHYFDVHDPYGDSAGDGAPTMWPRGILGQVAQRQRGKRKVLRRAQRLYEADASAVDRELDRLLGHLEATAAGFETHVVVTADHGESFGEGGSVGHGKRLTPEQLRVPLVLLSPRLEPGRVPTPVGSVDVAPTLLVLAGIEPARLTASGHDLAAGRPDRPVVGMRGTFPAGTSERRLDGTSHPVDRLLFYAVAGGTLARGDGGGLIDDDRRLLPRRRQAPIVELFAGFERQLESSAVDAEIDEEAAEALRALGYVN